jgi:membrane protease YdiL (CAAX protease family)
MHTSTPVAQPNWAKRIFVGPHGLRAGWRVLIFLALLVGIVLVCIQVVRAIGVHHSPGVISPGASLVGEILLFLSVMITTAVMGRFERRSFRDYGLPPWKDSLGKFSVGAIWGIVPLAVLLLALRGLGGLDFSGTELPTSALLRFGVLWALVFILTGITEEFAVRGYPQFTLTRAVGFWPAAIVTSLILGVAHAGNSGEAMLGLLGVFAVGLFACLMLRRTGDLWFPIGFHFAWDYGESFVFGVPDSGNVAVGHLLSTHMHGSKWLTGGSVGPEGSVLAFVVLGLTAFAFHRAYPSARLAWPVPGVSAGPIPPVVGNTE